MCLFGDFFLDPDWIRFYHRSHGMISKSTMYFFPHPPLWASEDFGFRKPTGIFRSSQFAFASEVAQKSKVKWQDVNGARDVEVWRKMGGNATGATFGHSFGCRFFFGENFGVVDGQHFNGFHCMGFPGY